MGESRVAGLGNGTKGVTMVIHSCASSILKGLNDQVNFVRPDVEAELNCCAEGEGRCRGWPDFAPAYVELLLHQARGRLIPRLSQVGGDQ